MYPEQPGAPQNMSERLDAPPQQPGAPRWVEVRYDSQQPIVVYTLLGLTILVYVLQLVSPYFVDTRSLMLDMGVMIYGTDPVSILGMKINELILQGQLWRLITPVLLHGSILHLGFNMYALNALGPELERHYGHWRFLALYLMAGFVGNVASFMFSPNPSLGSSTAIFGLLGAEGVFLYQNRELFGKNARRALMNIAMIAGFNLIIGLNPGIDNWGHIGGLIGGFSFAWVAGPLLKVQGIFPHLQVQDQRETGEVIRAGITLGILWLVFAAVAIYLRL
jgi:rhomboid protease GluP